MNAMNLLNQDINDTYMAAGADAYSHAREYYNSAQRGANNNIPGAEPPAAKTLFEKTAPWTPTKLFIHGQPMCFAS
jgi:hypothetical protein